MNRNLINVVWNIGLIFLLINGCVVFEQKDEAGDKTKKTIRVVPKVEAYHPYGRRDYQIGKTKYKVLSTHIGYDKTGKASWYGSKFHGKQTATQEIFNLYKFTAASPELPLPCFVEVINLKNNRSVIVRVNDRGPFVKGRLIDLSYAAAVALGFEEEGVVDVRVRGIDAKSWLTGQVIQRESKIKYQAGDCGNIKEEQSVESVNKGNKSESLNKMLELSSDDILSNRVVKVNEGNRRTLGVFQVGSFRVESNAEQLKQRLSALFPEVKVSVESEEGFFKVKLGPFGSQLLQDTVKMQLHKLELL